jgi:hypothetical protein
VFEALKAPVFILYINGDKPPVAPTTIVAEPETEELKHTFELGNILATGVAGAIKVNVSVEVHPLASVTVIVCNPN